MDYEHNHNSPYYTTLLCMYMYDLSDSMDVGDEVRSVGELERLVANKYIKLYMKLADTAGIQVLYKLAHSYTCMYYLNECRVTYVSYATVWDQSPSGLT